MEPASGQFHRAAETPSVAQRDVHQGPSQKEWEAVKDVIQRLYVKEQRSLKEIRLVLASEHGFRATERMYKARFLRWGFSKNLRSDDWVVLARLYKVRKTFGKRKTEFLVHGRKKTTADLLKHIKSKNMTEDQFLEAVQQESIPIPTYVRCYTPDPKESRGSPSQASTQDLSSPSPGKDPSGVQYTPSDSDSPETISYSSFKGGEHSSIPQLSVQMSSQAAGRPSAVPEMWTKVSPTGPSSATSSNSGGTWSNLAYETCDSTQRDLEEMATRIVRQETRRGSEDIRSWVLMSSCPSPQYLENSQAVCQRCQRSHSTHLPNSENISPRRSPRNLLNDDAEILGPVTTLILPESTKTRDAACIWVSLCFLACMQMTRGEDEVSRKTLRNAAAEFESMLLAKDLQMLTALNLTLTILHMHNQGHIATSILMSALQVARKHLAFGHPILVTIQWMTASAGLNVEQSGLTSASLRAVYRTFEAENGATHPFTLSAMYNLSHQLLTERCCDEAVENLEQLYTRTKARLGESHMLTIMTLNTLSRGLSEQDLVPAAIEIMDLSIDISKSIFGPSHPFRLEMKRRLALLYEKLGQKDLMEPLYWEVLQGRVKMLGPQHPFTLGAREDLISLLKELGQWKEEEEEEDQDPPGPLQRRINHLFQQETQSWLSSHTSF